MQNRPGICYRVAMKFSLADPADGYAISAYEEGVVTVAGKRHTASLVVAPDQIMEAWRPQQISELEREDLLALASLRPDILLLGTGRRQSFPEPEVYMELIRGGIGFEVMTTQAACRTYNILLSEGRRVVAALIIDGTPAASDT